MRKKLLIASGILILIVGGYLAGYFGYRYYLKKLPPSKKEFKTEKGPMPGVEEINRLEGKVKNIEDNIIKVTVTKNILGEIRDKEADFKADEKTAVFQFQKKENTRKFLGNGEKFWQGIKLGNLVEVVATKKDNLIIQITLL